MRLADLLRSSKKEDFLISNSEFSKDIDCIKEELSHYPNHVLSRALLNACKIITILDPSLEFLPEKKDLITLNQSQVGDLASSFAEKLMNVYLINKLEIDEALKREVN